MKKLLAVLLCALIAGGVYAGVESTGIGTTVGSGGGVQFGSTSGGTATRVLFTNGSGVLADDADMTFVTDTLTITKIGSTTLTGTNVATGRNTFGTAADAADTIDLGETAGQITWEGAAADAAEHRLAATVNAGFDTLTTIPATGASQTVMVLENAQTVTGAKTFSGINTFNTGGGITLSAGNGTIIAQDQSPIRFGTSNDANIVYQTAVTPDSLLMGLSADSMSIQITSLTNQGSDTNNGACGTSACTDPAVIVHSAVSDTTQYSHITAWGEVTRAIKTLTESSATSTIRIPVAASGFAGGTFNYCVVAADATDQQQRCSRIKVSVTNKAGTETCGMNTDTATANDASITELEDGNAASISTGTLTYAITCSTSPTNGVDIQINAVSSLTQTTLEARYSLLLNSVSGEPLRQ